MTGSEKDDGDRAAGNRPGPPEVDLAELQARRALDVFPEMVTMGVVYSCVEQVGRRWRILAAGLESPQQARDHLAHLLLFAASHATTDTERAQYRAAAGVLDRERHDELTVAGRRLRIGRVERSVRTGPDGPEPPRPTDPVGEPGEQHHSMPRRSEGLLDAVALTGTAAAATRYALRNKVPEGDPAVAEDASRALGTHQRLVLLPAEFVAAEDVDGRWRPRFTETEVTPQGARDRLAHYLRPPVITRGLQGPEADELYDQLITHLNSTRPSPHVCAEWEKAADRIDDEHLNDVHTAGYHFRIIRVDQIVRLGPDGPEPPRPLRSRPLRPTRPRMNPLGDRAGFDRSLSAVFDAFEDVCVGLLLPFGEVVPVGYV